MAKPKPPKGDWIRLYSGERFYPLDPRPEMIHLEDIAHALSLLCRWGGHTNAFYSVAEHSVLMAQHVRDEVRLQALLHDATEAYLGDVVRPLKRIIGGHYKFIEQNANKAIMGRFGLPHMLDPQVEEADQWITVDERRQLFEETDYEHEHEYQFPGFKIELPCWSPREAKLMFLNAFEEFSQ